MSKLKSILDGSRQPGVYHFASRFTAKTIRTPLEADGWRMFYLDGKEIKDKPSFLAAAQAAMEFPAYSGKNWDAFEECLTDLSWAQADGYVILFDHADTFEMNAPGDWTMVMDIFAEAVKNWHDSGTPMYVLVRGANAELPAL